jgi:hypothetical protein
VRILRCAQDDDLVGPPIALFRSLAATQLHTDAVAAFVGEGRPDPSACGYPTSDRLLLHRAGTRRAPCVLDASGALS